MKKRFTVYASKESKASRAIKAATNPDYPYEIFVDDPYDELFGDPNNPTPHWQKISVEELRRLHECSLVDDDNISPRDLENYELENGKEYEYTPALFDDYIKQGLRNGWLRPAQ